MPRALLAGAITITLTAALTLPAFAQQRLSRECRSELRSLCSERDREARRACIRDNIAQVSTSCRQELRAVMESRREEPRDTAPTAEAVAQLSYGPDERQGVDYYAPAIQSAAPPPLILFIHGGGWHIGSREGTVHAKPAHFTANGYAFASLGYRLLPDAPVEM